MSKIKDSAGVYAIRHKESGNEYIGSSVKVKTRYRQHEKLLVQGKHHSPYLQNAWAKYGRDAFEFVLLEACERDKAHLIEREQFYMDTRNPVYNNAKRADSRLGSKQSPEAIEKVRAVHLGRKNTPETIAKMSEVAMGNQRNLGRVQSDVTKAKISEFHKGKVWRTGPHTEETIEKIRNAQKGVPRPWQNGIKRSEETKAKMSAAQKGKPRQKASEETKAKMREAAARNKELKAALTKAQWERKRTEGKAEFSEEHRANIRAAQAKLKDQKSAQMKIRHARQRIAGAFSAPEMDLRGKWEPPTFRVLA